MRNMPWSSHFPHPPGLGADLPCSLPREANFARRACRAPNGGSQLTVDLRKGLVGRLLICLRPPAREGGAGAEQPVFGGERGSRLSPRFSRGRERDVGCFLALEANRLSRRGGRFQLLTVRLPAASHAIVFRNAGPVAIWPRRCKEDYPDLDVISRQGGTGNTVHNLFPTAGGCHVGKFGEKIVQHWDPPQLPFSFFARARHEVLGGAPFRGTTMPDGGRS